VAHTKISMARGIFANVNEPKRQNFSFRSENIETSYPLNVCLYDSTLLGHFLVLDDAKWVRDATMKIQCTYYYK
jgi:hypothetical protein